MRIEETSRDGAGGKCLYLIVRIMGLRIESRERRRENKRLLYHRFKE